MRLTLGDTTYDLATRALVIGVLDAAPSPETAKALMAEGADLLEVDGRAGLATAPAHAALVDDVVAAARTGAAVVVTAGPGPSAGAGGLAAWREAVVRRARDAEAAGIPPERIVLDPGLDRSPELIGRAPRFAELGYPVLVSHDGPAAIALAVTGGCRLVRTRDVRGARRVCDVLAAILEAGR